MKVSFAEIFFLLVLISVSLTTNVNQTIGKHQQEKLKNNKKGVLELISF